MFGYKNTKPYCDDDCMEDESRPIYDLMSPEINYTDQAIITLIPMKSSSFCSASTDGTSIQKKFISTSQHLVIAA